MTTRIVGGTVVAPNGSVLSSVQIDFELVLAEAFVVVGSYSLAGKLSIQTAADGTWSTPLQCNNDLTPVGTLYQVTEKIPSQNGGAKVYLIQVLTGLPVAPAISQVLNLIVPAAIPVGGTYAPVGSGPQGIQGPVGPSGVATEPTNAALNARTKVEGQPVYVTATKCWWGWNGVYYELISYPPFFTSVDRQNALAGVGVYVGQETYLKTNLATEGPEWRNSNGVAGKAWNMPWGMIGQIVPAGLSGQAVGAAFSTQTGLAVSLIRRRNYLLTVNFRAIVCTVNGAMRFGLTGVTHPAALPNTTLYLDNYVSLVAGNLGSLYASAPFTVLADNTYSIQVAALCSAGTGTVYADNPSFARVDDIGPAGAPL